MLFFAAWVTSMALIYNKNYAGSRIDHLADVESVATPELNSQRWFSVMVNGQKIGYAMNSFDRSTLGYVFKDYSLLRLPMAGVIREVLLDFYAVVDEDFSINTFTFGLASGEYSTDIFGSVKNGLVEMKVQTGGEPTTLTLPADRGLYLAGTVPLLLQSKGFPQGKFTLPGLDPISLAVQSMEINVGPKEKVEASGKKYEAFKVDIDVAGVNSVMWITEDGTPVRQEEAAGMSMVLTTREDALDIPEADPQWDILKSLAVDVDRKIENPRGLTSLEVELEGIKPAGFDLQDDFQQMVSEDPLILKIGIGSSPGKIEQQPDLAIFMKSEPFVQSDDPRIIAQARQIVNEQDDDSLKVIALTDWVYANIEKDYAISLPSAVDVLRVRRGDCNEHTALFTALARAAGIPAKICMGIVYSEGRFFYHAWPAVYLNGHWLPVDPTFGQHKADATHIKLLQGAYDAQASLMRLVGKLKVKVLSSSSAGGMTAGR